MIDRVLFLMERYCDADPNCGPTNSEHLVVDAIKGTGFVRECRQFYFDALSQEIGRDDMSEVLRSYCMSFKPDLIVYTPLGGSLGQRLNPSNHTIASLGTTVYLHLFDAKPGCGLESIWLPFVNYLGINDCISAFLYYRSDPRIIMGYSATGPDFQDRGMERDIDVCFVGSVDPDDRRWPMRSEYTSYLRDNGIDILVDGGQRGHRLEVKEYAGILGRSKMALDFCRDGNGLACLKSRVFEALSCGALLLEDEGSDAGMLLEEGRDFISYGSKDDLLRIARYYLDHDEERRAIARSGRDKATEIFNARNMWGHILTTMGYGLPELAGDMAFRMHESVMDRVCGV